MSTSNQPVILVLGECAMHFLTLQTISDTLSPRPLSKKCKIFPHQPFYKRKGRPNTGRTGRLGSSDDYGGLQWQGSFLSVLRQG